MYTVIDKTILFKEIANHPVIKNNSFKMNKIKIEMSHSVIQLCLKIAIIKNKELIMLQ